MHAYQICGGSVTCRGCNRRTHTLPYTAFGHGSPTVLIEPGFGEDASGRQPMSQCLADLATDLL